jgi:SAM-dependent methyltransferase
MQDRSQRPVFAPEDVDFEAFYQGKPPVEGVGGFDVAPWDIGEPQPAVVAVEESGGLRGDILDVGCGLGDNAMFLAERGYRVVGVDGSATALQRARERVAGRGIDVQFLLGEATRLDGFEQRFDTVVDSALYHCLGDEQRTEYAAALHRVTWPGAQLHLFCFSDNDVQIFPSPMRVSQDDLGRHLSDHWQLRSIDPAHYTTALTRDSFQDRLQTTFQALGGHIDVNALRVDAQGRVLADVWHVQAVRK